MLRLLICSMLLISACRKEGEEKKPFIDFSYSGNISNLPVTVSFTSSPNDAGTIEWDFGDGHTASGQNVTHTYDSAGFYSVYAKLITSYGTAGKTKNVNASPFSKMRISKIEGTVPSLNPSGLSWDTDPSNTAPDPFFRVFDANNVEKGHEGGYVILNNVFANTTIYNPSIIMTNFDDPFRVQMLDYDPGNPVDEIMGTFYFRPADYFRGNGIFVTQLNQTDAMSNANVRLTVQWMN